MRVLMLQTVPGPGGTIGFAKDTHVDVPQELGEAWEKDGVAMEDPVPGADKPAPISIDNILQERIAFLKTGHPEISYNVRLGGASQIEELVILSKTASRPQARSPLLREPT